MMTMIPNIAASCSSIILRSSLDDGFGETAVSLSVTDDADDTTDQFREVRRRVMTFLQAGDIEGAKELIVGMLEFLQEASEIKGSSDRTAICEVVDDAFQAYFNSAFARPYKGKAAKSRIGAGMDLIQQQLSSDVLVAPYNLIPKRTLLSALRALSNVNEVKSVDAVSRGLTNTDEAYRILQRLVTGAGVRNANPKVKAMKLYESDFNMVLNAYSNVGRMDMAHRIVALQERTHGAPALSPVAYSILLKGYGRLGDLNNIEMLLNHAEASKVEPDAIMLNSLMDAYINCDELEKANDIFEYISNPDQDSKVVSEHKGLFSASKCPAPNKRTYNIFLKGLAKKGLLGDALDLSQEMRERKLWDNVTTNTLVQAAVKSYDFARAENILLEHTSPGEKARKGRHPNVEAYTTLMDGYAKVGDLQKAISLLKLMKARGVEPNEYTYTCLIGGFARSKKVVQAYKMMSFMKSTGLRVAAVTYNSFISGLVHRDEFVDDDEFDKYVDEAIKLLRLMMKAGIRPNAVTISVIVDAFGKCYRPRIAEAVSLVDRLERDGVVAANNTKISTALIQAYGASEDLEGARRSFQRIKKHDVASINAFLDACVRCENEKAAIETFDYFFRDSAELRRPDVISFSIMVASQFKKKSSGGSRKARKLYEEMKFRRRIMPDRALVDIILKAMIENGNSGGLLATDVRFIAGVLRDAEKLDWGEGQLERRKRAIETVMTGRIADTWEEEANLYGLLDADDYEDSLFKRHGWNKVDSGFNLWGAEASASDAPKQQRDAFLQSKGWNNVDSGFRII